MNDERAPVLGLPRMATGAITAGNLTATVADTVVVSLFEGEAALAQAVEAVDGALGASIRELLASGQPLGKRGTITVLYPRGTVGAKRVLVIGLGERELFDAEAARRASADAARKALALGAARVATVAHGAEGSALPLEEAAQATLEGALLATYAYGGYRTGAAQAGRLEHVELIVNEEELAKATPGAAAAVAVARGAALARDLVNLPANIATPAYLVGVAAELATDHGLRYQHGDRVWAEREGLGAFLAITQGSRNEPAFIELEHNAHREDLPLIVLVGKGVTFDSGGLSLKSRDGMIPMKSDMAGAAAVLGTMLTVAELDLPVRVLGLCACVENMPDGNAFRPSDVLVSGSGLSVEVLSTDAEGRLALADALWYVQRFTPSAVIDIATLTGASARALGRGVAASLFANDAALKGRVEEAAAATGERVWRMPMFDDYREMIASKVADLKNSGSAAGGGASTAAVFLEAFTDYPWAHLDIAGMQMIDSPKARNYLSEGATGFGVRLFVEFLRGWEQAD